MEDIYNLVAQKMGDVDTRLQKIEAKLVELQDQKKQAILSVAAEIDNNIQTGDAIGTIDKKLQEVAAQIDDIDKRVGAMAEASPIPGVVKKKMDRGRSLPALRLVGATRKAETDEAKTGAAKTGEEGTGKVATSGPAPEAETSEAKTCEPVLEAKTSQ